MDHGKEGQGSLGHEGGYAIGLLGSSVAGCGK